MGLRAEIEIDLLSRGYSSMTDLEVATDLNTVYRTANIEFVTGQEIFEAVVLLEYNALSAAEKSLFHAIIGMEHILVSGANTRASLLAMFGTGTTTRSNLIALQTKTISRAEELGFPFVYEGHIQEARL